jgi:sodium-dependent dicarboxylate transporter 2/3/5
MPPFKLGILLVNLAIFFSILFWSPFEAALSKGLAIFIFIAVLWITETFHVSITSLLVPVLAVLLGIFDITTALVEFANPIIFLFLGGFALAAALHKHKLDQFIATKLITLAKGQMLYSSFLIFGLTAFSSMWISNTATVAMMMPLVIGLLSHLDFNSHKSTYLYFLLGTAYSGSIGGMGTLIGSPPNAIAASAIDISFTDWMLFGIPMVLLSLPVMIAVLYFTLRPQIHERIETIHSEFDISPASKRVALIFLSTVLCWVFSKQIAKVLGIEGDIDALVAIAAVIALSVCHVASWQDISDSTDWGVLVLFGGGITLSSILKVTGTSLFLAEGIMSLIQNLPLMVFILLIVAFVVFLTELVSNTASTALLVPIFISIADAMHISSSTMAVIIALSASCAFMLPVATPPNAIVFGTRYVLQKDMMHVGLRLNLVLIALISTLGIVFI